MAGRRRRPARLLDELIATLGTAGLMIAALSILCTAFGLAILARESDRPRRTLRDAVQPIITSWVRTVPVSYLGWTLVDMADRWRRASPEEQATRLAELRAALNALGNQLHPTGDRRAPLIEIVAMDLSTAGARGEALATWAEVNPQLSGPSSEVDEVDLLDPEGDLPRLVLGVRYRAAPDLAQAAEGLADAYFRLVLSVLGLSMFPLLCLIYMVVQVGSLRDRAAREAAQEATLDLANRTCHELGNVAFVLQNERRNLADHLDLIERFVAEHPAALAEAARRVGLDPTQAERLQRAVGRELGRRGLDPEVELRDDAALARHLCRQVAVCSEYIALTVRELDGYLRQSAVPVQVAPTDVRACLEDALTILGPRLESAGVILERIGQAGGNGPARSAGESGDPRPPARAALSAISHALDGVGDVRSDGRDCSTSQLDNDLRGIDGTGGSGSLLVRADRRLLVHALVNLLKNAVEAASQGDRPPRIVVGAWPEGDLLVISVADNGPGVEPEAIPRLFEVGYSTKGAGRGRGLGIVRESIHAQGGSIEVAGRPGEGAEFRILLPRDNGAE